MTFDSMRIQKSRAGGQLPIVPACSLDIALYQNDLWCCSLRSGEQERDIVQWSWQFMEVAREWLRKGGSIDVRSVRGGNRMVDSKDAKNLGSVEK